MVENNKKLDIPKFTIGELVKHKFYPFRGVIFDVDPEFMNSEEWYDSIQKTFDPSEINHFITIYENDDGPYIAYIPTKFIT